MADLSNQNKNPKNSTGPDIKGYVQGAKSAASMTRGQEGKSKEQIKKEREEVGGATLKGIADYSTGGKGSSIISKFENAPLIGRLIKKREAELGKKIEKPLATAGKATGLSKKSRGATSVAEPEENEEESFDEEGSLEEEEDSRANQARQTAATAAKQKAKQAAIRATMPYWGAACVVLVISFLVFMIVLGLINAFVNHGSAGKTKGQLLSKGDPSDEALKDQVMANAGEDAALSRSIASQTESALASVQGILDVAKEKNLPAVQEEAQTLQAEILALGTGNSSADKANIERLQKRVSILLGDKEDFKEASEKVKTTNPGQNKDAVGDMEKLSRVREEMTKSPESKQGLILLKTQLQKLETIVATTVSSKLVISEKDKYYIRSYQVDRRVLKALNYLVTPINQGGAGFRKIKVGRIKSSYDSEGRKFSKEWDFTTSEDRSVSPHFSGQAFDVTAIDYVDRRLYKKGIVRKKIKKLPSKDILVALQSNKSGKGIGNSLTSSGETFGLLAEDASTSVLLAQISEMTGYNLEGLDVGSGSFADLTKNIGLAILAEELGSSMDSDQSNGSFEDLLKNVGAEAIADCLDLPKSSFDVYGIENLAVGDSQLAALDFAGKPAATLEENIGRALTEQRLNLAPGSLIGASSEEILKNLGKRKLEKNLGLPNLSLENISNNTDVVAHIGQIVIEQRINLPKNSLSSNNLPDIKSALGEKLFRNAFAINPASTDTILGLDPKGTRLTFDSNDPELGTLKQMNGKYIVAPSQKLASGQYSVLDYKKMVGASLLQTKIGSFATYPIATTKILPFSGIIMVPSSLLGSQKDEAMDMPDGSIKKILEEKSNIESALSDIGLDEIIKRLTDNSNERDVLYQWHSLNKNLSSEKRVELDTIGFRPTINTPLKKASISALDDSSSISLNADSLGNTFNLVSRYGPTETKINDKKNLSKAEISSLDIKIGEKLAKDELEKYKDDYENETTDSFFAYITESYFDESLALPDNALEDILLNNKAGEVFAQIGNNKTTVIKETNGLLGKGVGVDAQLDSLYQKRARLEEDLDFFKSNAESATTDKEEKEYEKEADASKKELNKINSQIRLLEYEKESLYQETQKQAKDKVSCSKKSISSIINNQDTGSLVESIAKIGASVLESDLELPAGSLSGALTTIQAFGTKPKPEEVSAIQLQSIGIRYLEDSLGFKKRVFNEPNVLGVVILAGGYDKFFAKLFPGRSGNEMAKKLPVESNPAYFKAAGEDLDKRLGIGRGASYDFLTTKINTAEFTAMVGRAYLDSTSSDSLNGTVNTTNFGSVINSDNIISLLAGNAKDIGLKIGATYVESGLELPPGTVTGIIHGADSSCQDFNVSLGCIENILAAAGKDKLAGFMGVYEDISASDNSKEKIAQNKIESALGGSLPAGWFEGESLLDIKNNVTKKQNLDARYVDQQILQAFGFDTKNPNFNLNVLRQIDFLQNTDYYNVAINVDRKLGLSEGTSAKLFRDNISVTNYKKEVYSNYADGRIDELGKNLLGEDAQKIMEKFDLRPSELKDLLKNPDDLKNRAIFNAIPAREMSLLFGLGLGDKLPIPIEGEFTANFAQKQVEETLGLSNGSFSPDRPISEVAKINGAKNFARAFRITIPSDKKTDAEVLQFLNSDVFSGGAYWQLPTTEFLTGNIDAALKLDKAGRMTQKLLSGSLSIANYLESVRQNQFKKLDTDGFLGFLASNNIEELGSIPTYIATAKTALDLIKNPDALKTPGTQLQILSALKNSAGIDLDDKWGLSPGTLENFIANPKEGRGILISEGIRMLGEEQFLDDPKAQIALSLAYNYLIPNKPGAVGDALGRLISETNPNQNSCGVIPTQTIQEDFSLGQTSVCQFSLMNTLQNRINKLTDEMVPGDNNGVKVPINDLTNIINGDMRSLSVIGIAFTVNSVNATKDPNGESTGIIPAGFQVSYEEIKGAIWGDTGKRQDVSKKTSNDYFANNAFLLASNPEAYQKGLDEAINEAQDKVIPDARRDLQFKYVDAQVAALSSKLVGNEVVPPIPPNFSKVMFTGTPGERNKMLVGYGFTYMINNTDIIGDDLAEQKNVMEVLSKVANTGNLDSIGLDLKEAGKKDLYGFLDSQLADSIGIKGLPSGTAEALYGKVFQGKEFSANFKDSWDNFGLNYIGGVADKQLGLPPGTTTKTYGIYKDFKSGSISKGDAIGLAIAVVFGKQLAKADAAIGLPPGSLSSIISASIVGGPVAWAFAAFTVLFGFSKVEVQMTCLPISDMVNYGRWCKEKNELYSQWAQYNVRRLLDAMLKIEERTKEKGLLPTIIGTFNQEDIDYFNGKKDSAQTVFWPIPVKDDFIRKYYGPPSIFRGLKGLHQSDYMEGFVHIGY